MPAPSTPSWLLTASRRRASLRVSDAERAEVADLLSGHYADGRLDKAEFEQRTDLAMRARTYADLSGLLTDLPQAGPPQPETAGTPDQAGPPAPLQPRRRHHPLLLIALIVVAAIVTGRAMVWSLGWGGPWPVIALLGLLAVYVAQRRRSRR